MAVFIGAVGGAAAYTISYVVNGILTGEWTWSWSEFAGSIIGGAVAGGLAFVMPSLSISALAFISGVVSNSTTMLIKNAFEGKNFSAVEILYSSIFAGGLSAVTAGIARYIKIPKITGKGGFGQIYNQILTKFRRGLISNIRFKTFEKMFIYDFTYQMIDQFSDLIYNLLFKNN